MARTQTAQLHVDLANLMKPATPLGEVLWGRALNFSAAVDFTKMEWKFKLCADQAAGPGMYLVVPAQLVAEAMQAEARLVVLKEPGAANVEWQHGFSASYERLTAWHPDHGEVFRVQRRRLADGGDVPDPYWYGSETRLDAQGREWSTETQYYVTDDFGFLAEVQR